MYKVSYNFNGNPVGIQSLDETMNIPLDERNRDFRKFLEWNKAQKKPLDYETPIEPRPQEPEETMEEKIKRIAIEEIVKDKAK